MRPSTHAMNHPFVRIEIRDKGSLLKACDILHDARFDLTTLHVNEQDGVWNGRFEREFFENPSLMKHERKFFIFEKVSFPLADSELTLNGIRSFEIHDKSRIGVYQFDECRIVEDVITLFFCEDMHMKLTFKDQPQGTLVDHKILDKQGAFYMLKHSTSTLKRAGQRGHPESPASRPGQTGTS